MRRLRQNVDVPLSAVTHDINQIKKEYSFYKGSAIVKALKKNFFDAYYVENKSEAAKLLHQLIPTTGSLESAIPIPSTNSIWKAS